jgi:alpha-methylacyl-CoA racemase
VVIDPFRPGVLGRLPFGPDELLRRCSGLVIARLTGWGQDGPYALRAGLVAGKVVGTVAAAG